MCSVCEPVTGVTGTLMSLVTTARTNQVDGEADA